MVTSLGEPVDRACRHKASKPCRRHCQCHDLHLTVPLLHGSIKRLLRGATPDAANLEARGPGPAGLDAAPVRAAEDPVQAERLQIALGAATRHAKTLSVTRLTAASRNGGTSATARAADILASRRETPGRTPRRAVRRLSWNFASFNWVMSGSAEGREEEISLRVCSSRCFFCHSI